MRIIAGAYRSRVLAAPDGMSTRPTSDRLRETLFNVLAPKIAGSRFLDLYAGSGAVGIEALSRGASKVTFVERAAPALKALRTNLAALRIETGFTIHSAGVAAFLRGPRSNAAEFDLVFLDPPYDAEEEYEATLALLGGEAAGFLAADAIVIAEHRRKKVLEESYGAIGRTRVLKQGDAALSFYSRAGGRPENDS
jgi:16S rRNA (guanine(966)-N(2))-methyltransferase RsmD